MSEVTEAGQRIVGAPPPVLSAAEHLQNVCVLAAGIASRREGSSAEDVMFAYHKLIDAYVADGAFPTS